MKPYIYDQGGTWYWWCPRCGASSTVGYPGYNLVELDYQTKHECKEEDMK